MRKILGLILASLLISGFLFAADPKFEAFESGTFTNNIWQITNTLGRTVALGSIVVSGNLSTNAKSQIILTRNGQSAYPIVVASGYVSNNIAWVDGNGGIPFKTNDVISWRISVVTATQTNHYEVQNLSD